jgi:hypothetical protein
MPEESQEGTLRHRGIIFIILASAKRKLMTKNQARRGKKG